MQPIRCAPVRLFVSAAEKSIHNHKEIFHHGHSKDLQHHRKRSSHPQSVHTRKTRHSRRGVAPGTGTRVLDLGSGSGEMLCTWARDYGVTGTGYRYEPIVLRSGEAPRSQLRVSDQVAFIHGDAAGYVAAEKVGVAACLGAT